ncbi:MAG: hypothetical protein RIS94_744 [Pseudomonadota bacterium]|jgi:hypothetical protein
MNNLLKSQLLVATAFAGMVAGTAQAQVTYPAAELHAMGASSVAVILPRELNCVGPATGHSTVGKNDGTASAITEGAYAGTDAPFDCATKNIQPNLAGKYISTGSGGGKTAWKNIDASAFFTGAAGAIFPSSFGTTWSNPHFVMSDSPVAAADFTTFANKAANTAGKNAGAAIQIPLYVLPVAFAYNPVYGHKTTENVDLTFNVGTPVTVNGVVSGGMRLSKKVYCGIFNGYITNWNDAAITALNTKIVAKKTVAVSLMDTVNDTATRWAADGAPIRLVGRLDKSGTTDIFTRHLAATCNGGIMGTSNPNKYLNAAEALPYNTASGITLTSFRSDSPYKTSATNGTSFAGTTNMLSGAVWTGSAIDSTQGTEAAGLFMVADGSGKVASAINAAPDRASATDGNVLLNGKFGYIGADFVKPSPSQLLHAAALEQGQSNSTKKPVFVMPTALNAQAAFGVKILPPESDRGGKYVKATSAAQFSRSNPADWYEALYSGDSTLANPSLGYPATGTTQFVSGTCFADPAVRNAMVNFLNASLGNLKFDAAKNKLSSETFTGVKAGKLGFKAQMGIAPLPKAWKVAITETFLTRSKQKAADATLLGARNLYIQNGLPTATGLAKGKAGLVLTAADMPTTATSLNAKGVAVYNEAGPNPSCTAGSGL